MKKFLLTMVAVLATTSLQAKTLIAYYSFTNNVHTIATELQTQTGADIVRIEPAEKGIDYAANNYAVGSSLISAIRANPNDASSYPAIDDVNINFADYDVIIIAAPLWWSNMAAPMQTFLFQYGAQMAGKHIGLIVSSASSGISGVVSDAKRLIPDGDFLELNLWIRSSQTSNCPTLLAQWLQNIGYSEMVSSIGGVGVDSQESSAQTLRLTDRALYNMEGKLVKQDGALPAGVYFKRTATGVQKFLVSK